MAAVGFEFQLLALQVLCNYNNSCNCNLDCNCTIFDDNIICKKRIYYELIESNQLITLLKPRKLTSLSSVASKPKYSHAHTNTTCFNKEDITEGITDNARNYLSIVIGLPYFCGGDESSPSAPNLKCTTSPGLLT